jgi:hypothetical protein
VRAIDQDRNALAVALGNDLLDREHEPAAGRNVVDDHQPGSPVQPRQHRVCDGRTAPGRQRNQSHAQVRASSSHGTMQLRQDRRITVVSRQHLVPGSQPDP